jgi:hypothetical protein
LAWFGSGRFTLGVGSGVWKLVSSSWSLVRLEVGKVGEVITLATVLVQSNNQEGPVLGTSVSGARHNQGIKT